MSGRGRVAGGAAALCAVVALLAGCTVGPDYRRPQIATPPSFSEAGTAKTDPLSRPVPAAADLSRWWLQFDDPLLNWLVDQALAQNLNLQAATARLRQAREAEIVARSAGLPQASTSATVARLNDNASASPLSAILGSGGAGGSGFRAPSHLDLYAADFDATWEIDIFGGVRRSREQARANTQAALWQRRDGEVSLTAEVANAYLTLRELQQQIRIAQGEAQAQAANFTIVKQQAQTGFVTRLNINQQDAQVQATIAEIPQLQAQARAQVHALAVLLAMAPDALDSRLSPDSPLPSVPAELPIGLPSDLLLRRPDVRQAERQLASATAAIGVQVASLYPRFNIRAIGPAFASTTTAGLFDPDRAASLGYGMIQWPVFQGGRIRANIRSARAQADAAYLNYRQTILGALRNVEDVLARYQADQQRIVALRRSVASAENSQTIAEQQFQVGLVTFLNVLQAQATVLNARNQMVQADGQLAQDLTSLYTALGGGWSADGGALLRKPGISGP